MKPNHSIINRKNRSSFSQILEGLEGVAVITACYLTIFMKPLRDRWGISQKEADKSFPGDHVIKNPKSKFTHAIPIDAPSTCVWPWIAQIGQGRGGFYSYEVLENLAGMNIYNADVILPAFQDPKIGDIIPFDDKGGYPLVLVDPGRAMAIEVAYDLDAKKVFNPDSGFPGNYLHLTWLWYVEALDESHSRFISRNRVTFNHSFKNKLMFGPFAEPIIFAMDRKMCLGIKKRAERLYEQSSKTDWH